MAKKQDQQKGSQVPSVKNVDIEQPLKGMNQDMSAQAQPDGTYRFALNAVNNTEEGQQGYIGHPLGEECLGTGDTNGDGSINVMDIVLMTESLMGNLELDEGQFVRADTNCDGAVDVIDIINIVNMIMEQ